MSKTTVIKTPEGDYQIEIKKDGLQLPINIENEDYLLCPEKQLEGLLKRLEDYKNDINELHNCISSVLDVMGIYDPETKDIKKAIKTGEESYFKYILRALKDTVVLLTQSKMGLKSSEKELLQKFAFIKNIIPLIEKHGRK